MKTSLFHYDLPEGRIAQRPLKTRDASRLLVLNRDTGALAHSFIRDLPRFLSPGDLLVVNDSRVIPARLIARKNQPFDSLRSLGAGGEAGAKLEVFLIRETSKKGPVWETLVCPGKRVKGPVVLHFAKGGRAEVVADLGEGRFLVNFSTIRDFKGFLRKNGHVPLPPYIRRPDETADRKRYQTVYAKRDGSVAAPTAGLHFTPALLKKLEKTGIRRASVTLHVGLGTFLQVSTEEVEDHKMHEESFGVPEETVDAVKKTKAAGKRVVAVGTTALRALESAARDGELKAGAGTTDLFITPGYRFKVVDSLLTNYHQPESTLLMLVSALAGRDLILKVYQEAINQGYRFFSYGDAMLILRQDI